MTNVYSLDRHDTIVSVGGPWDEFAIENGGVGVLTKDVCDRPYWNFITGEATRMWVATLFGAARVLSKVIERPYRCDSPNLKRFMQMRVVPGGNGALRIEHKIIREEPRTPAIKIRHEASKVKDILQRCSCCGRVKKEGWQEPLAEYVDASGWISVTYGICEDCNSNMPSKHSFNNIQETTIDQ